VKSFTASPVSTEIRATVSEQDKISEGVADTHLESAPALPPRFPLKPPALNIKFSL